MKHTEIVWLINDIKLFIMLSQLNLLNSFFRIFPLATLLKLCFKAINVVKLKLNKTKLVKLNNDIKLSKFVFNKLIKYNF